MWTCVSNGLPPSSGALRRRGNIGSGPPCSSSGLPAIGGLPAQSGPDTLGVLNDGRSCSLASSCLAQSGENSSSVPFSISPPPVKLVTHIPKAARLRGAAMFESCLRDVVRVGSLASWNRLLRFSSSSSQPNRGDYRFNLSSQILAQLERFDSGPPPWCLMYVGLV